MKKNEIPQVLIPLTVLLLIYLVGQNYIKAKRIGVLDAALKANHDLYDQIKNQIRLLIASSPNLDSDIAKELKEISDLIEIKQDSRAVMVIAKIIESLLRELFEKNEAFINEMKAKSRNATFHDYIDYALKTGTICKEDFHHLKIIKEIRNEEAHKLAVRKKRSLIAASFIAGISITLSLYRIAREKAEDYFFAIQKPLN
ncbi:MAG: hypothetical protein JWN76_2462 [Chitinophagaceae bacterium]|nr:hypothetical protein [Chitinophagaceae bacterium]